MGYRDCFRCKEAGTKPKRAKGIRLVCDPRMTMPGPPTIENHRLGAEFMAEYVYALGIDYAAWAYELTREELIVACWWVGEYGDRRTILVKALSEWADIAAGHLWYGCLNIPDPPCKKKQPTDA